MEPSALRARLLDWYDDNARVLPWRIGPQARAAGQRPDPYAVWLSEVMLQQTTAPHAASYYLKFLTRWPTVQALAEAEDSEVMAAWAGLGYYARARNLIACARAVAGEHGGIFPGDEAGLAALPGVGAYTAAAVAAIAFDWPANVVDGNVERVMARLFDVQAPLPAAKPVLKALAAGLVGNERPGDWAQALMDLGATLCRPKAPLCERCPVAEACAARAAGRAERLPRRTTKPERPRRYGAAYVLTLGGSIGLVRRPPKGLLGGMLGLPTSEWASARLDAAAARAEAPAAGPWRRVGEIEHVFTHFALTLEVWRAEADNAAPPLLWLPRQSIAELPSVFLKAARLALET